MAPLYKHYIQTHQQKHFGLNHQTVNSLKYEIRVWINLKNHQELNSFSSSS